MKIVHGIWIVVCMVVAGLVLWGVTDDEKHMLPPEETFVVYEGDRLVIAGNGMLEAGGTSPFVMTSALPEGLNSILGQPTERPLGLGTGDYYTASHPIHDGDRWFVRDANQVVLRITGPEMVIVTVTPGIATRSLYGVTIWMITLIIWAVGAIFIEA